MDRDRGAREERTHVWSRVAPAILFWLQCFNSFGQAPRDRSLRMGASAASVASRIDITTKQWSVSNDATCQQR